MFSASSYQCFQPFFKLCFEIVSHRFWHDSVKFWICKFVQILVNFFHLLLGFYSKFLWHLDAVVSEKDSLSITICHWSYGNLKRADGKKLRQLKEDVVFLVFDQFVLLPVLVLLVLVVVVLFLFVIFFFLLFLFFLFFLLLFCCKYSPYVLGRISTKDFLPCHESTEPLAR